VLANDRTGLEGGKLQAMREEISRRALVRR
jgi:hypothetical protein